MNRLCSSPSNCQQHNNIFFIIKSCIIIYLRRQFGHAIISNECVPCEVCTFGHSQWRRHTTATRDRADNISNMNTINLWLLFKRKPARFAWLSLTAEGWLLATKRNSIWTWNVGSNIPLEHGISNDFLVNMLPPFQFAPDYAVVYSVCVCTVIIAVRSLQWQCIDGDHPIRSHDGSRRIVWLQWIGNGWRAIASPFACIIRRFFFAHSPDLRNSGTNHCCATDDNDNNTQSRSTVRNGMRVCCATINWVNVSLEWNYLITTIRVSFRGISWWISLSSLIHNRYRKTWAFNSWPISIVWWNTVDMLFTLQITDNQRTTTTISRFITGAMFDWFFKKKEIYIFLKVKYLFDVYIETFFRIHFANDEGANISRVYMECCPRTSISCIEFDFKFKLPNQILCQFSGMIQHQTYLNEYMKSH